MEEASTVNNLSINTLTEERKPKVTEKLQIEIGDTTKLSSFSGFLHYQDSKERIKILLFSLEKFPEKEKFYLSP